MPEMRALVVFSGLLVGVVLVLGDDQIVQTMLIIIAGFVFADWWSKH